MTRNAGLSDILFQNIPKGHKCIAERPRADNDGIDQPARMNRLISLGACSSNVIPFSPQTV